MNIKPILFNTEMVQAILDDSKSVTRRVVKPQPINTVGKIATERYHKPYGDGDILYVRETWYYENHMHDRTEGQPDLPSGRYSHRYIFKADYPDYPVNVGVGEHGWKPSIHMPKEAARIFLKVTDVRVERLQDIDDDGVVAEGLNIGAPFDECWNRTIKPEDRNQYGWDANPWVWVISFERINKND